LEEAAGVAGLEAEFGEGFGGAAAAGTCVRA